jgi:NTE family protein
MEAPRFERDHCALALSGGGFRATLFQLGAVEFLLEAHILERIRYITSVSGGSILAAKLALHWNAIVTAPESERRRAFQTLVAEPIRLAAQLDVRNRSLRRALRPKGWFRTRAENLASVLDDILLQGAQLRDLPDIRRLRVAINATNLRTGKRFRFSQDSIGDYQMGYAEPGHTKLATAVAASAAFPLIFAPLPFELQGPIVRWTFDHPPRPEPVSHERMRVTVADGGVYDNVALEGASRRCGEIIALDASLPLDIETTARGPFFGTLRAVDVMMSQIVNHPIRKFVGDLQAGSRKGVLVRTTQSAAHIATVPVDSIPPLPLDSAVGLDARDVDLVSRIRTDLDSFSALEIDLLQFHGRSLTSAALRRFQPRWIKSDPGRIETPRVLFDEERARLKAGAARRLVGFFALWNGW